MGANPSYILLSLAVLFGAHAVTADALNLQHPTNPDITYLQAGVICPPLTIGTVDAPDTVAGATHVIDVEPEFVSTTQLVPAVLGIGFGVKSQTDRFGGLEGVTMVVTHPAMGPSAATSQSFTTSISDLDPSLTFYQFDYAYELLTGTWQMTALLDEQVLYQVSFDVVALETVPELASACGYRDLLS